MGQDYKIKYCFGMGDVLRICWGVLTGIHVESADMEMFSIYRCERLSMTDTIAGNLPPMNKSQCYWITFCLTSAMCATTNFYSNKGILILTFPMLAL